MKIIIDIDCQTTICGACRYLIGQQSSGFGCTLFHPKTGWRLAETETRWPRRWQPCLDAEHVIDEPDEPETPGWRGTI